MDFFQALCYIFVNFKWDIVVELYCIRHGESEANKTKKHSGWGSTRLSELGNIQANKLKEFIQKIKFDYVIASDLLRTRLTAELVLPGHDYQLDDRIREYGVGSLEGRLIEDCIREDGELYIRALAEHDFTVYGGENSEMVIQRTAAFMQEMEAKEAGIYRNCKIAAVGHFGSIRHILYYVLGYQLSSDKIAINNCSLTKLKFENGKWRICFVNCCESIG